MVTRRPGRSKYKEKESYTFASVHAFRHSATDVDNWPSAQTSCDWPCPSALAPAWLLPAAMLPASMASLSSVPTVDPASVPAPGATVSAALNDWGR